MEINNDPVFIVYPSVRDCLLTPCFPCKTHTHTRVLSYYIRLRFRTGSVPTRTHVIYLNSGAWTATHARNVYPMTRLQFVQGKHR